MRITEEERVREAEFNQLWERMYPRKDRVAMAMIAVGLIGLLVMGMLA